MSDADTFTDPTEDPCRRIAESRLWYFPLFAAAMFVLAVLWPLWSVLEAITVGRGRIDLAIGSGLLTSLWFLILGGIALFPSYVAFATEIPMIRECDAIDWQPSRRLYTVLYLLPPFPVFLVVIYSVNYLRKVYSYDGVPVSAGQ